MTYVAIGGTQAKPTGIITREAKRDLSSYQYHAVKLDADALIDYVDTSNAGPVAGILQTAPDAAGKEAEVATKGTSLAKLGGTVNEGDKLGSNSAYRLVAITGDDEIYFAMALEGGDTGELAEVKLLGQQYISAGTD